MGPTNSVAGVRRDWHALAVRHCQLFAMTATVWDRQAFLADVQALIARIETPETITERILITNLLFEMAVRGGRDLHWRFHRMFPGPCRFSSGDLIQRSWAPDAVKQPQAAFQNWATAFTHEIDRCHVLPAEHRVRTTIEQTFHKQLLLDRLAFDTGTSARALRTAFRKAFGMSPYEYQKLLRMRKAIRLLASGASVKFVALDVGYSSRNKFYAAFVRSVGIRPAAVKALSAPAIAELSQRLDLVSYSSASLNLREITASCDLWRAGLRRA